LVVREDEHRRVVRRVFAPPAPPGLVRPRPADGAEHVPAHEDGAEILAPGDRLSVVDARLPALLTVLRAPAPRRERPLVERLGALPERILEALVGPGGVPVDRHRDVDPHKRHPDHPAATPSAARSSSSITIFPI